MHDKKQPELSVLASLRALAPSQPIRTGEAVRLAMRQARRLLVLTDAHTYPVPASVITGQEHIRVEYAHMPISGMTYWTGHDWLIRISADEPADCQRFTLFHEYKHIIDHPKAALLYRRGAGALSGALNEEAERAADDFAGAALVPSRALRSLWSAEHGNVRRLAQEFEVSERAIEVRAAQLRLTGARPRVLGLVRHNRAERATRRHEPRQVTLTGAHR